MPAGKQKFMNMRTSPISCRRFVDNVPLALGFRQSARQKMQYCMFLTGLPGLAALAYRPAKSRDWFKVFKLETVCLFLPTSQFDGLGMYGQGGGKLDLAVVPVWFGP